MKLSARNLLKGTVTAITTGTTTTHVKIDLGHGMTITSAITNEAAADLGLKVGGSAVAVIKASDVIVGVE
ncbi:TOBE domain-containing protein [Mycobacterium tuberculosis]|nr:TOBE domain-containing protein [Mycobacterium tuberculosis]MBP0649533.1 TOBE domain-containing protein [Mycobacterium tuberculosis]